MNRRDADKKTWTVIILIFAVIVALELLIFGTLSRHNALELLTVSLDFINGLLLFLLIDLPIFIALAVVGHMIKELVLYRNSYKKSKGKATLITLASVFTFLSVALFFTTSNITNYILGDIFYFATLVSAALSVIFFAIYLIKKL